MKKTLVALAALAATGAFAQSSVTISGIMDVGVVYNTNVNPGAPNWSVGLGNNNRINFGGVEDLGGGMKATFAVGMRFNPATGAAEGGAPIGSTSAGNVASGGAKDANGTLLVDSKGNNFTVVNFARPLFQGETRVGLSGGFGSIQLGRGLPALPLYNGGMLDPWGVSTVAGSVYAPGYATDYIAGGEGRTDGIFYTSPVMGGLQGAITYSPRTVVTTAGNVASPNQGWSKSFYSVALTYVNGPIQALIGTEQNRYGDTLTNLGGNYDFGVAKLYLGYAIVKGGAFADRANVLFSAVASGVPGCSAAGGQCGPIAAGTTTNLWTIGTNIPMGAARIRAGYSSWANDAAGAQRDTKLGLGVNYALSKRTSIYSDLASITRNNNVAGTNPSTNNDNVTAFDLGIAHSF